MPAKGERDCLLKDNSHGMETETSPEESLRRRTGHEPFLFQGSKTGVLLVHGFTGTAEEMRYLGDRLNQDFGFTVSGVLLAGHGGSFSAFQEKGWTDWYQSVQTGFFQLQETCDSLFVVGFSMGGLLSIHLTLDFGDEIRALALISTPLYVNRYKARLASYGYRLPGIKKYLIRKSRLMTPEQSPLRRDLAPALASFSQLKWILRRKAVCLRHPTLLLHSKNDPSVPWENVLSLSRIISSVDKRTVLFSRSLHVLPTDLDRDRVVQEVGSFFSSYL